jgi:hypothetical protein
MLSIATQYRKNGGTFYVFKGGEARLTVFIIARASDGDPDAWRVDAWSGPTAGAHRVTGWGPTRGDALASAARSWTDQPVLLALPAVDWETVERSLANVRALESR